MMMQVQAPFRLTPPHVLTPQGLVVPMPVAAPIRISVPALTTEQLLELFEVYEAGQILEVSYPDCPTPHYGLVYQFVNGVPYILHNSKSKGQGLVLEPIKGFTQDNKAKIVARPDSDQHLQFILNQARYALSVGWVYVLETQNCEHFVVWCYTGEKKSPTVEKYTDFATLIALVGASLIVINAASPNKPKRVGTRRRRS
ncbi:MAG: lecithin retinol acyltransferase family protein [Bryobacteraceae bacterium]